MLPVLRIPKARSTGHRPNFVRVKQKDDQTSFCSLQGTPVDEYVEEQETFAREMYADVIKNHPGTPWERRAEYELKRGFGMRFYSVFRDPNYDKLDIKLPKP